MIDLNLFRTNPELIRNSQKKRNASVELVDQVIELDKAWIKAKFEYDGTNKDLNALQKQIADLMKEGKGADDLIKQRQKKAAAGKTIEEEYKEIEKKLFAAVKLAGNIVHDSVVVSNDEEENNVVAKWDSEVKTACVSGELLPNYQVLDKIGGCDSKRGQKVAGHRGYFLRNDIVFLNQALINYGLHFLRRKNYAALHTPFLMTASCMEKCVQLEDFDEQLYTVNEQDAEKKYLIATSEQPIAAYHSDEWFDDQKNELPLMYCGYSTCFRKEAGAHGKDTLGLFRVHQFEKIEQFVFAKPGESWELHEKMIKTSEEFYQSLNLSYRVVGIVSGALNNAAAKKYDLEAWFPATKQYRELVSCSNCTDYQSRDLNVRYGKGRGDSGGEKQYVHCLNGTLCATERTLSCILENYQQDGGVVVPEVLRPFMHGIEFIEYQAAE